LSADDYAEKYGFIVVALDSYGYVWSMLVFGGDVTRR